MFKIFSRRERYEDWSEVYNTTDPWEAEVVRTALLSAGIRARVKIVGQDRKNRASTGRTVTESSLVRCSGKVFRWDLMVVCSDAVET